MRLERKSKGGSRFWEITLDGRTVATRWGQAGATEHARVEQLPSASAARAAYDLQLAQQLKKGFTLAPGQAPVSPAEKIDPRLERAVVERPDDERVYLVLADALSEAGDPRGELISVQHALAQRPGDARLRARERKLLSAFGLPDPQWVTLGWRWGFLQAVRFHDAPERGAPGLDPRDLARGVFQMPMCAALEQLHLGLLRYRFEPGDTAAVLREAAKQPWAPRLRALSVGHRSPHGLEQAHRSLGDLTFLSAAFPGLRSLFIHASDFALGRLELPLLEELTLETCALTAERLAAVTRGDLPKLERLELWFGSSACGADVTLDQVSPILEGAGLPWVRHLGLRNAAFTDALCEALPTATILPQLRVLDLSMGTMSDAGARALARKPAALRHLLALDVDDNFLGGQGLQALGAIGCPVRSRGQKEQDGEARWVSLGDA